VKRVQNVSQRWKKKNFSCSTCSVKCLINIVSTLSSILEHDRFLQVTITTSNVYEFECADFFVSVLVFSRMTRESITTIIDEI
jgi:hypothetical protein